MFFFRIYVWWLWITGERDPDGNPLTTVDREFYTYKLRRQKQRLGWPWYIAPLGTIAILTGWMIWSLWCHRWLQGAFATLLQAFGWWLFWHVLASDDTGPIRSIR